MENKKISPRPKSISVGDVFRLPGNVEVTITGVAVKVSGPERSPVTTTEVTYEYVIGVPGEGPLKTGDSRARADVVAKWWNLDPQGAAVEVVENFHAKTPKTPKTPKKA